jgi:MFS transporter, FHS family, L-fucose permease
MGNKLNMRQILPVLLGFFVMSFVDLVGIGKDLVKDDLHLSEFILGFIPFAAFVWFFILSVPVGILQSRIGKKITLNIGMGITGLALILPIISYNVFMVIVCFALLGIGNTIVQVSANPLLVEVVPQNRTSSFLSFSQFVKAIGSMISPYLATLFVAQFGNWRLLFLVYGIVSFLAILWLGSIKVDEVAHTERKATFRSCMRLLADRYVFLMVFAIFLVVGIDVGFNTHSGTFLLSQYGFKPEDAKVGRSVYFLGRTLGTFLGALVLTRITSRDFLFWTSILGLIALTVVMFMSGMLEGWILVFIIGFAVANIFPLVFSLAVERYPDRHSEISGLMMMAISGGAIVPFLIGWIGEITGNFTVGMSLLCLCMLYILIVSVMNKKQSAVSNS